MWHALGKSVYKVLVGKPEGKRPVGTMRMGSEWILGRLAVGRRVGGGLWSGFGWLIIGIGRRLL
jgi:hypothetical protein